ncbi:MAG TPA: hypothetical protein VJA47_01645 [archaeon]|nr:hypothetical protein [archaeon]
MEFLEFVDDVFGVLIEPVSRGWHYIDDNLPRFLHPLGFSNVYNRLEKLQQTNENTLFQRALYHTRHQTNFYKSSQFNWLSGE